MMGAGSRERGWDGTMSDETGDNRAPGTHSVRWLMQFELMVFVNIANQTTMVPPSGHRMSP